MDLLHTTYFHNTVLKWIIATCITVLVLIILPVGKAFIAKKIKQLSFKTQTRWDDLIATLIQKTKSIVVITTALFLGAQVLTFPSHIGGLIEGVFTVVVLFQVALWASQVLEFLIQDTVKRKLEEDTSSVPMISFVGFFGKLILWALVALLALDNLGVNITSLVAGLGIGGIAIGLASQQILGDLFASLSIVLDKPFVHGDFIIVGDCLGTVEKIGLKTTRVRSLSGEQLIFSNSDLLNSRIRNYKRMWDRRVVFGIGVTYQTPHEKLKQIPEMLKEIVTQQEKTRFDRVHFKSYGDFSLNFEVVYYVQSPEYNQYMDIQQAINLEIFKRFEKEGLEFAYPTQTLFVQKEA